MSKEYSEKLSEPKDEELLAWLGYKQEFKRDFSWLELLGLSFSITGVVQSITTVLVYSLPNGGAVAMVWGWTVCCFFFMAIACSLAELASAAPTSGGLYYWSFKFSSEKYRRILSWTVGYSNSAGWISGFAGLDYATALQIFAAVTIGSGGAFVPTTSQIFGLFCGLVIFHAILASLATKLVARVQVFYLSLNILVFLVLVIALPVATPAEFKNSASYVFGNFENLTLWPNGFAFLLSFLAPTWTMGGIDAPVHISEEARNASVAVPRTIIMSTALGCLLGWAFNVVIAFNMGTNVETILSNPIGQPMATIIFNSLGQKGCLAVWSFIIVIMNMASMDILIASSRQMFAFSRDGALPFSKVLYRINKTTGTPVMCVIFCAVVAILLGLLSFAGTAAVGAVFSMGIVCQYIAYSIPIMARHLGGKEFTPGPFSLGRLSVPVTFTAVAFMAFIIIILLFPLNPGPTPATMNYTIVVVGGTLTLSTVYYFFPVYGGRHWFSGPVRNIDDKSTEEVEDKESYEKVA
ncbi:amino acid/polyamine transporter I [Gymnopilus junonius]|uniref:Amino acid/polyamine transporter I n=1 Tax=Gymnopilus junonius TaxID=109634 RepID=A0A9P5N915_GYMJU|nr:amino acid/polyamine transporter I [Gymnopilus junonius]